MALLAAEPAFRLAAELAAPADPRVFDARAELILWDAGARVAKRALLPDAIPTLALVEDEEAALAVLRAGALAVLFRNADGERVLSALRALASGSAVLEPAILRTFVSARAAPNDALTLTPRETEVLNLVAEGLSNKSIAERLRISEHTAKFHVNAILNKFGAETRTEAVVMAARRGLLML
ncbi:MAG TPA: response regulator transcription factor [Polyangiaceae bacterium]|nr:response regulator transcription factor [Polyangiaceae bacterium]